MIISDKDKRAFYEQECQNASWSVRIWKKGSSAISRISFWNWGVVFYIPDKEQLINEVKSLLEQDTEDQSAD